MLKRWPISTAVLGVNEKSSTTQHNTAHYQQLQWPVSVKAAKVCSNVSE